MARPAIGNIRARVRQPDNPSYLFRCAEWMNCPIASACAAIVFSGPVALMK